MYDCVPLQAWRAAPTSEPRNPRPGPSPLGPDLVSGGGGLHPLLQPVEGRQVFREGEEPHDHTTVCQYSSLITSGREVGGASSSQHLLTLLIPTDLSVGKLRPGTHERPVGVFNLAS